MKTKHLIIGNSIAGVNAIEAIREVDREGKIILISDEGILNYSRPLIPYYLGGKLKKEKMNFKEENFYQENKVEVRLGRKAEKIDIGKKEVYLKRDEKIKFDKLLISTGGKPIVPPIEGLNNQEGIFTFTKFEDAEKIISYLEKNKIKEAVVLGAGLIGLKCTEGLIERGIKVTLVELADRILANTFDRNASEILEIALSKQGCRVIKKDTVVGIIAGNGKIREIVLKSNRNIPTELLVIAIGVQPNLDLVKDTPIKFNRGIIVDKYMQTTVKNIYAAGDVAEGKDFLLEKNSVLAIWPVAARQGKIAGLNMARKITPYEGSLIMNSVELAGIPTISFGITNVSESEGFEILSKKDIEKSLYRKIVLKDNRIVGAIFLGKIERAGIFSGLIKDKIPVSTFKKDLLSDDFGFLVLPSEYRKHRVRGEGTEV